MKPKLRFQGFHDDWEEKKLGEVAEYENGKAHESYVDKDGKYILINSKFISSNGKVIKQVNKADKKLFADDIAMVLSDVPNGKALAKAYYVSQNNLYTLNQRICRIHSKILNNKFLYFLINRNQYFLRFDTGVGQTNLSKLDVLNFNCHFPSLPEQEKIGAFLSQLDDRIEKQEQKIALLKERKKGWMQQLFSQTIRFKDENGQDYPAWEEKKLGEVAEIKGGYAFKSQDFTNNGVPVITISNISKYIYNNQLFSHSTLEDKKILIGEEKDILVALSGATTGKSGQIKEGKYYINQRIARIRHLNSKNLNPYIFNWINSNYFYRQLNTLLVAGAQPNLSIIDLNNLRISVPSLPEQEKIAEFLSKQDELIEKEEEKLSLFKAQKKGLLQQMFV